MIKLLDLNNDWQQERPTLILSEKEINFLGYQKFTIKNKVIFPTSENTKLKFNIVKKYIYNDVNNNTITDLCCANTFFGYFSALNGATNITGVDLDKEYKKLNKMLITYLNLNNIQIIEKQATEYTNSSDITFAFATIHWLYSCSGFLQSLENVINHLSNITNKILYVEWIDPKDSCILEFKHLDYNNKNTKKDYNKNNFLKYLSDNFNSIEFLGSSKGTREIFRCVK